MAAAEPVLMPIGELSPYNRQWTIKARVTNKAQMRTFSKGSGQGKVFHVELLDAEGGEIRASFFNQAVDKYHDMLEKGKCFTFSRGNTKVANKQYNTTNHRYELTFDKDAIIEPAKDDAKIEVVKYNFVGLRTVAQRMLPATIDVCGIIVSSKPTQTVQSKEGVELLKREITVADDTKTSMVVTLWGERAKQADSVFEGHPAVVLKSVLVKEFRETRTGSLLQGGDLIINSSLPDAQRIKEWWSQNGSTQELVQLSEQKDGGAGDASRARNAKPTNLTGLREAQDTLGANAEIFSLVTRLALVQTRKQGEVQPLHYMACQEPKASNNYPCNKRVNEQGVCPVCDKPGGKVAPRLNIRCRYVDYEDAAWLTSFHEAAAKILGMSGEEVRTMELAAAERGEAGREEFDNRIKERYFDKPLNITVRANMQVYNGEPRANMAVIDCQPVDHGKHGRSMLKDINELLAAQAVAGA